MCPTSLGDTIWQPHLTVIFSRARFYETFISFFYQNHYPVKICSSMFVCGITDSFRWITLIRERRVQTKLGRCCLINALVVILLRYGCLHSLNSILMPLFGADLIATLMSWLEPHVIKTLVIVPLFTFTKFIWIIQGTDEDIFNCRHLRTDPAVKSNFITWTVKYTMDPFLSVGIHYCFLLQIVMLSYIFPFTAIGECLLLVHFCLLYSLLAFELVWFSKGWEVNRRLKHIENNWVYFLGFGLPHAILTMTTSWFVSGLIFATTLPLFIISASEADSSKRVTQRSIFPLSIFLPTRTMAVILIYIVTKETLLFKHLLNKL